MARSYHDPMLKRRTLEFLHNLGLGVTTSEEHEQLSTWEEPETLRQPPVQIDTVTPVRRSIRLNVRGPERVDLAVVGTGSLLIAYVFILLFWVTSTFPVSVKLVGIGASFFVVGLSLLGLAYWVYTGGRRG